MEGLITDISDMALPTGENPETTFPELPLEIRQLNYKEITVDHILTKPDSTITVKLLKGPFKSFLLLNEGIHDEYVDEIAKHTIVHIDLGPPNAKHLHSLDASLQEDIPHRCLAKTNVVAIHAFWTHGTASDEERSCPWLCPHHVPWPFAHFEHMESLENEWTPSKALRSILKGIFADMQSLCHPNTAVSLMVDMTLYPDSSDPLVRSNCMAYYRPTIEKLLNDDMVWAKTGNLKILYHMRTPKFELLVPGQGHGHLEDAKGEVAWLLYPTDDDAVSYSGFRPEFVRVLIDAELENVQVDDSGDADGHVEHDESDGSA